MTDPQLTPAMDPEALIAQVERDILAAEERAASATKLVQELDAIRVELDSPDRKVWVQVDASGRLLDVGFAESAASLPPSRLRTVLLETIRSASHEAARRAVELTEKSAGEPLATQLRGEYEARIGPISQGEDETGGTGER